MATLSTKYVDSTLLNALLLRIAEMYKSLKGYTDEAVDGLDISAYFAGASYNSEAATISFVNSDGDEVAFIDASAFILDGMLSSVSYDSGTATMTFTFNTDAGKEDISVDLSSLIDTYTAGDGISISDNAISAVVSSSSESYLSVDESGLAVTGIDAIEERVEAVEAWIDESIITEDEMDAMITTLDATYDGFAEATGVTSTE